MLQVMLPQINIELLNRLAQNYVIDNNLIISFTAPEKETVKLPTKEEALAQLADVKAMELTAPKEETIDKKLVTKTPKRGKIKVATTMTAGTAAGTGNPHFMGVIVEKGQTVTYTARPGGDLTELRGEYESVKPVDRGTFHLKKAAKDP